MPRSAPGGRRFASSARYVAGRGLMLAAGLVSLPPAIAAAQGGGGKPVTGPEYEGWRQYSVHCARCHGQDVLGNPVAANLLISVAEGGPASDEATFAKIVREGRPSRGMPASGSSLKPEQIAAIYAYVKGRADKKIPPGRPRTAK